MRRKRQRAESSFRGLHYAVESVYRDLVEHSQDLICTHDLDGRLLSVNPLPARLLGYSVEELLRTPMKMLLAPEVRDQFDAYLERIRSNGTDSGLLLLMTRTGERRIWEYHNTLRTEGLAIPLVRGMAHDITERYRAEVELRKSAAEREKLIAQLQAALDKVKQLSGLLNTCAYCKKIRGADGVWHPVEKYISEHSEASFSHGICPDCIHELYPGSFNSNPRA